MIPSDSNSLSLVCTVPRATVSLGSIQFESLTIEFCGKVLEAAGEMDEYVAKFETASDLAQFRVALRCFTRSPG